MLEYLYYQCKISRKNNICFPGAAESLKIWGCTLHSFTRTFEGEGFASIIVIIYGGRGQNCPSNPLHPPNSDGPAANSTGECVCNRIQEQNSLYYLLDGQVCIKFGVVCPGGTFSSSQINFYLCSVFMLCPT